MQLTNFVLLLLGIALMSACEDQSSRQSRPIRPNVATVITVEIESRLVVDEIQALGTARANESIEIRPRVASLIQRIDFEEGEFVKKGDLLVELENSEIAAGLALAEAELAESKSIYVRSQSLASSQAISASNLDQLIAQVKINEAQVQAARARLSNTRIAAPFSGVVGLRRVSPGSFVNSQTVITTLDDVRKIKLDFSVPETFLNAVEDGMRILGRSVVYPGKVFEGTVTSIDTRLDTVSRAVQVRATIPNEDGLLKPGMFMTVDLQRDDGEVIVAPEQALVPEGSMQFVYVVNGDIVEKRVVEIGRRTPGLVVINGGLSVGDRIVSEGTSKIRDGATILDVGSVDAGNRESGNKKVGNADL